MKKATVKLLRAFSESPKHLETLKAWWSGLTRPEREQAAKEIREELEKRMIANQE